MSQRQSGHVLTESLVLTTVLLAAVFLPVPIIDESVFSFLASAIRKFQAHSIYLLAMP